MMYIARLDGTKYPAELVGGKAAALSSLIAVGVRIPFGVCLTTAAFSEVVQQGQAWDEILDAMAKCDVLSHTSLVRTSDHIKQIVATQELPTDIVREVAATLVNLGETIGHTTGIRYVVRSSATIEDSAGESFAGQFDSILGVSDLPEILRAISQCWASLFGSRALLYMTERGIDVRRVGMGVIIQQFLPAEVSGIAFSADPQTGDRGVVIVNTHSGPGDEIVGGMASAAHIVVDKKSRAVRVDEVEPPHLPEDQPRHGGAEANERNLTDDALQELVDVVLQVDAAFGVPQDVEWVRENGRFSVVQARPITTEGTDGKNTSEVEMRPVQPAGKWTRRFLNEWFVLPLTPLFTSLQLDGLFRATGRLFSEQLGVTLKEPHYSVFHGYLYITAQIVVRHFLDLPRQSRRELATLAERWKEQVVPAHVAAIARLRAVPVHELPDREALAFLDLTSAQNAHYFAWNIYTGLFCFVTEWAWRFSYGIAFPGRPRAEYAEILAGYPNKSLEADRILSRVCRMIRREHALRQELDRRSDSEVLEMLRSESFPEAIREGWRELLDDYGHRVFDLDFYFPTATDDPSSMLSALRGCVGADQSVDPEERFLVARARREQHEARLQSSFRGRRIASVMRVAQRYAAIRESRPFYLHLGWPILRRALQVIGTRLCARGILAYSNDVCFLHVDEVRSLLLNDSSISSQDARELVTLRRRTWQSQKAFRPPPDIGAFSILRLFGSQLAWPRRRNIKGSAVGTPGSGGRAVGPARVVAGPHEFANVRQGDVLVVRYTTPAWTILFNRIAALVTDVGGSLSHGAIVAREYGIPAVLGTGDATRRIPDGAVVSVDGDRGSVSW